MYLSFAEPIFLWLMPIAILVMGLLVYFSWHRSRSRLERFAEADHRAWLLANVSTSRRWWKTGLLCGGILLTMLALARPQYGETKTEKAGRGVELLVALDLSASMRAEDVTPNRLERAKLAILDLLERMPGSKIGLIVYTREGFLQVPLTLDHQAFAETLQEVDTYTLPQGGTSVAAAIAEAREAFGDNDSHHLLFIFSDGEDLEGEAIAMARQSADDLLVYTVGVGTAEGGLIPDPRQGQGNFLRDPVSNEIVRTKLDARTLQQIAQLTGGEYVQLNSSGSGFTQLVNDAMDRIPPEDLGTTEQTVRIERFQWPLLAAICLLALEFIMGTRRRARGVARAALPLLVGWFVLGLGLPPRVEAASLREEAQKAYDAKDYTSAIDAYRLALEEAPDDARLHYNLGIALYRNGQYEEALQEFGKSLQTDDLKLQADTFFNLGNTYYEQGAAVVDDDGPAAAKIWQEATKSFRNAIALRNDDYPEAQDNLAYVRNRLAELMRTVTLKADPAAGGTVDGGGEYIRDQQVKISAEANDGWRFAFWAGEPVGGEQEPTQSFKIEKNVNISAHFIKVWDLTVQVAPSEAGSAKESGTYDENKPVDISTEGNDYWAFKGWDIEGSAEVVDPSKPQTQISLQSDVTATAKYVEAWKLTVQGEPALGVNAGPSGFFEKGKDVDLQAKARDGFSWLGWIGEGIADPTQPQTTVHLDRDRSVTARVQRDWNLVVLPDSDEHGTTTGGGNYSDGEAVPITVEPKEGYEFVRWQGEGIADPEATETTVTKQPGDQDVIAIFDSENQDNQNNSGGGGGGGGKSDQNQDSKNQDKNQDQQNQNNNQNQNQDQQQNNDQDQQDQKQDQQPQEPQQDQGQQDDSDQQQGDQDQDQSQGEQEPQQGQPDQPQDEGQQQPDEPSEGEQESQPSEPGEQPQQPQPQAGQQAAEAGDEQQGQAAPAELQQMTAEEAAALLRQLEDQGETLPASRRARARQQDNSQGRNW
ncbi:MAG: Mg-chelatase subunit ChlD [Puniceicoccaceae bacterium 5H]|nr:MAG: Mg-chelatase subunit ChlD [Puniceicoccaceae bacterium 5H]